LNYSLPRALPFFLFLIVALFVQTPGWAAELGGVPASSSEQGEAFVRTWIEFRQDLDVLAHARTHPARLGFWFAKMPLFLVRDAARLATDPLVILAAARRLASEDMAANRSILNDLRQKHAGGLLGPRLWGELIRAGDVEARRRALDQLHNATVTIALPAAVALTSAGEKRGRLFLKELIRRGENGSDFAVRALGRIGGEEDSTFISRERARRPNNAALAEAYGDVALQKVFPWHHEMLLRRSAQSRDFSSTDGLYQTWFVIAGNAIRAGCANSEEFLSKVNELKRKPYRDLDEEVFRRRITALIDFWKTVDEQLNVALPRPRWPSSYSEALNRMGNRNAVAGDSHRDFSDRVEAEIVILDALGEKIDYPRLATPLSRLAVLTPGGGRAVDGNMATAWHMSSGSSLILEHMPNVRVQSLSLMSFCPAGGGARIETLLISGKDGSKIWTREVSTDADSPYFQTIEIAKTSNRRLTITAVKIEGEGPACIAEIRAVFK
jgi:hypothetical protein